MTYLFVALFGLVLGSFLNVCIARLPLGLSVVHPRSNCPHCHHTIRWYDNVPVLSYIWLRGRCRDCQEPISLIYPLVEILNAGLMLAAYVVDGFSLRFVHDAIFMMLLLVLVFTDLFELRIPHVVTVPGIVVGLVLSCFVRVDARPLLPILLHYGVVPPSTLAGDFTAAQRLISFLGAVTGALAGGGLFYLVGEAFYRLRHIAGMGGGDIMLMLLVGTFLGLPLTLLTVLLGSLLGVFVAIPFLILNRRRFWRFKWPYGSFLGAAGIYTCLWGNQLLESYLRWSGFIG
jgi:leader peptidase (prepilin peptidase)/N-methyltransferase